jgi:transposase
MSYVGVDLHKKVIQICVIRLEGNQRKVACSRRFSCQDEATILAFFQGLGPFQVVVEATASYEWFVKLVEPLAERVVLAHPKKLRIIAESTHKTDKIDARILGELLALDMIPRAYRPTPRQREYRVLVRYRYYMQRRTVSLRSKIRRILSNYNADREDLFSSAGLAYLKSVKVSAADRFVLGELVPPWKEYVRRLRVADKELAKFAADEEMPIAEREAREILASFPCVGPVTMDVILSELADVKRFRSQKKGVSYAGLAPGIRESAGKTKHLHITKEGSRMLRWALVQLAWRLVNKVAYWGKIFDRLQQRTGRKKAVVAVARHAFSVMIAMLQAGQKYRFGGPANASAQESESGLAHQGPKVEKHRKTARPAKAKCARPAQTPPVEKLASATTGPSAGGKRRKADSGSASPPPSGPAPALGSHPCVALSSGQATLSKAHNKAKVKRLPRSVLT